MKRFSTKLKISASLAFVLFFKRLLLREEDALNLGIELNRVHTHLAANAALFVAPEGRFCMHAMAGIDRDYTRAHAFRYTDGPAKILRPHRACQAICCVVGLPDRFLLAIKG